MGEGIFSRGPEVTNSNRDGIYQGPYAGRDMYLTVSGEKERGFVVTHRSNIKPTSYFTGREEELWELQERIGEKRKSVLISGMGGVGKTQICRKLFENYLNQHGDETGKETFSHIGYVEYTGDMSGSLQMCLNYERQKDPELDREAAWKELEYLASLGKLLLFVDNVNIPIKEDSGLARLREIAGTLVLTSRRAAFSKEFEPYRIGFLSTKHCREIFEKILFENSGKQVKEEEEKDLTYVIEKMAARHTITVELLAHLTWAKGWTVKRLRRELEQNGFWLEYRDM